VLKARLFCWLSVLFDGNVGLPCGATEVLSWTEIKMDKILKWTDTLVRT
jgi:hypothetical protein